MRQVFLLFLISYVLISPNTVDGELIKKFLKKLIIAGALAGADSANLNSIPQVNSGGYNSFNYGVDDGLLQTNSRVNRNYQRYPDSSGKLQEYSTYSTSGYHYGGARATGFDSTQVWGNNGPTYGGYSGGCSYVSCGVNRYCDSVRGICRNFH